MSQGERGRSVKLDASDHEGIAQLGAALRAAGYTPDRMKVALRAEGDNLTPRPEDVVVVLRLLPQRDRLADVIQLFLLGVTLEASRVAAALAPLTVDRALRLGILERSGEDLRAAVRILPSGDLVFACDRELESSPDLPIDHVMGVSTSSIFLASLTIREPVRDVLDVGCGGGIQSVLAAKHARRVVACDVNPRALDFTRFNASLNGVTNVECRLGSFFEPAQGETFDLVVSNPPFVVSPDSALTFRDSGMRGDGVSRMVVREAAAHLADGGHAFVLISWGVPAAVHWDAPLRAWAKGLGCDAWFLHQASATPLGYAATWNEPLQRGPDPAAYAAALDRWTREYAALGYAAIGYGAAILRKRAARTHWTRTDDIGGQREPASGAQVTRLIAAEDYLATHDDAQLQRARLAIEPAHRLEQVLHARDGTFVVESAALALTDGLRFRTDIDAFSAELIARLDGRRTLAEAATDACRRFVTKDLQVTEFVAAAPAIARRLLALGFVRLNGD